MPITFSALYMIVSEAALEKTFERFVDGYRLHINTSILLEFWNKGVVVIVLQWLLI